MFETYIKEKEEKNPFQWMYNFKKGWKRNDQKGAEGKRCTREKIKIIYNPGGSGGGLKSEAIV